MNDFCTEVKHAMADYQGFTNALRIAILRHYRNRASLEIVGPPARPGLGLAHLDPTDGLVQPTSA